MIGREPVTAATVGLEQGALTAGPLRLFVTLDAASRRLMLDLDDIGQTEARPPEIEQAERHYLERRS